MSNSTKTIDKWMPIALAIIFGCAFLGLGIAEAVKYSNPAYWEYEKVREQERTRRHTEFWQRAEDAPVGSDTTFRIEIGK